MTAEKLIFAREMPTSIEDQEMRRYLDQGCKGVHESILRSYHIVQAVKELIRDEWTLDAIEVAIGIMEGVGPLGNQVAIPENNISKEQ